jgi:DNA repair exonuclease SbcCD ATPase subunit
VAKLRQRLESYVVRQTGDLVDDLGDEERKELAEVLHDLEGFSPRAADAETRMEELVEKLESRTILVEKSRARIEELERELGQAKAVNDDREERFAAEIETERIYAAQREQNFRTELEAREAELRRRIEGVEGRERELVHSDRLLAERGRTLSLRESEVETRAQELKARSDEALSEREQELAGREAELEQLERTAADEKQVLERRSIHVAERERRTELQLSRLQEREEKLAEETAVLEQLTTELAQREEQLERRKRELDTYVSRVQGSLPFQP